MCKPASVWKGLAISVISVGEIYDGLYGSDKMEEQERIFLDFLGNVENLDIDPEVAKVFGKIRHNLRKEGRIIDNFDLLIASTCLSHGITLVTGNIEHFKKIKGLKIS